MANRMVALVKYLVVGLILVAPGLVWANGEEFFEQEEGAESQLVYFGRVKDKAGALLEGVTFQVDTKNADIHVPFAQDIAGHYRSPDIADSFKVQYVDFEPGLVTITASKAGYKSLTKKVPDKFTGAQEIDFTLESEGAATTGMTGRGARNRTFAAGGVLLALALGAWVIKSNRKSRVAT